LQDHNHFNFMFILINIFQITFNQRIIYIYI